MSTILISPFSQKLRNNQQNAKNYPYWQDVISKLRQSGMVSEIIQIGVGNEYRFEGVTHMFNLDLKDVERIVKTTDLWISVDNFFPHMCNAQGVQVKGIVLFSKSDPLLFGYAQNMNILKDRKYLRPDQFMIWEQCPYDDQAYVSADFVVGKALELIEAKKLA